jgi:hypothetical protein
VPKEKAKIAIEEGVACMQDEGKGLDGVKNAKPRCCIIFFNATDNTDIEKSTVLTEK